MMVMVYFMFSYLELKKAFNKITNNYLSISMKFAHTVYSYKVAYSLTICFKRSTVKYCLDKNLIKFWNSVMTIYLLFYNNYKALYYCTKLSHHYFYPEAFWITTSGIWKKNNSYWSFYEQNKYRVFIK